MRRKFAYRLVSHLTWTGELYEKICREIKKEIPKMHIHGFSPEEVLYGATTNGITIRDYLLRLKNAGVGTIPGTSAEILDQKMRDKISPGRISVKDWIKVIKTAHKIGIRSTSNYDVWSRGKLCGPCQSHWNNSQNTEGDWRIYRICAAQFRTHRSAHVQAWFVQGNSTWR